MNERGHVSELHVQEKWAHHNEHQQALPIICGKTLVSKIRSEVRNRRSEVSHQRSEVASRNSEATFLARNKERFRLFDHAAQHSANLCTFSGQGMVLFRRDISALLGKVQR